MVILSPSPSSFSATTTSSSFFSLSRVSPPPPPLPLPFPFSFPSLKFFSLSARFTSPKFASPSLRTRAMAELVKDEESTHTSVAAVLSSSDGRNELGHSRTFLDARSEDELLLGIKAESEAGRLPLNVALGMEELYYNYKNALDTTSQHEQVFESGVPRADEIVLSNMAVALDRILLDVEDPFVFAPCHKAIREPFDYFMFGQNYIRPLIDFRNSFIGNIGLFLEMEKQLQKGHNIVLISNHQTEADPAVIALLLEKTRPHIVEKMAYVAGDRVVTDPLSKPFSMGRNLICVYSKKHMFDVPELAEMKRKANIRSLKEMSLLFRGGSQIVWIAPSGGRDRPDLSTGEWYPAPFDPSSVDNMRRLAEHSGVPSHIYPLALLCHDIMPPPPQVEKEIGEKREIRFSGAGLSVAPEISFSAIASACENPEEAKVAYTREIYSSVTEQYDVLRSAIHGRKGIEASIPNVSLTQP